MLSYIGQRMLIMIPTLIAISLCAFAIIQLPPGDFLTTYVAQLAVQGEHVDRAELEALTLRYGLDRPFLEQYWRWISNIILRRDFGQSFTWNRPVSELIWDRIGFTMLITGLTVILTWVVAIPVGVYSAVRQYSPGDYVVTFLGFIGLATPSFLLALVLMFVAYKYLGLSVGGLFSLGYMEAPWSWGRVVDLLAHVWIPVIILGTAGTAGLIRIMRANLLDELHKNYVVTARAKGISETRLIWKYPVRVALNPFVSTIGWILPTLISGSIIVSVVMNLPTTGPLLLQALLSQDMYLAGSFILILSVLTVVGTLISDVLLAWLDPRVRFQ